MTATATTVGMVMVGLLVAAIALGCPLCGNPGHVPAAERVVYGYGDGYGVLTPQTASGLNPLPRFALERGTATATDTATDELLDQVRIAWTSPREIPLARLGDATADNGTSRWTWRWSLVKMADTLTSIGVGASLRLIEITETAGLWLDGAPFYDDVSAHVSGFLGLSTEANGLPLIRNLNQVFSKAFGSGASNVGFGLVLYDDQGEVEARGMAYATWQF